MAIMENTSSNMSSSQAGPNTPGAPATPQQDQPATPIAQQYNMPGTPGQSSNIGTPNTSHGKMVSSAMYPGKGAAQQPINQQGTTSMGNMTQFSTGGVPQVNTSQQAPLSHGQLMSPQGQTSIRPSAPQRAVIAAKQAEQLAKQQASTGSLRSNLQPGVVRHVKQNPMQRPGLPMGGGMQQNQWANPGGGDFVRHPSNPNMGITATVGNSAAMQGSSATISQQKNERWINMMTKNPQLAAHVIKQTRQQQRPPQVIITFLMFEKRWFVLQYRNLLK